MPLFSEAIRAGACQGNPVKGVRLLNPNNARDRLLSSEETGRLFAVANAFTEEMWYRGFLLGALKPLVTPARAIILQALIFGLMHWFGTPQGVLGVVLAGAWGGLLGWWVYKRGSIWPAFVVHFFADFLIFAYTN